MNDRRRHFKSCIVFCVALGVTLLLLNFAGIVAPMRAEMIDGYVDFAGGETRDTASTLSMLAALKAQDLPAADLAREATRLIHEGIAHVDPGDVEQYGFAHFGMSVPITENWVLFLLRFIKPDTYRDYEFCNYRKSVERGTGRCGQQALALVSFLSETGLQTGFVALGGHAVAMAEVAPDSWHLLDPDFGGVIPFGIEWAASNPDELLQYYWSDAAQERRVHETFLPENQIKLGGPEARYGRACIIERWAYIAKWVLPSLLILFGVSALIFRSLSPRS